MMNMKMKNLENKTVLIWKMAIASAISWEVAKLVGSDHPYLAPLSVVLCTQTTINHSIRYSFHRIVGTVIGVVLTAYLISHLSLNGWILGLLILGGTFIAKWMRLDEMVLHQVALTIILIFTFERNSKDYALDRIVDTIIGVVIALVVHMVLSPPDFTKKAISSFRNLTQQLSGIFLEISNWIEFEWGQGKVSAIEYKIDHLLHELHTTKDMLKAASKSLEFNPLSKKHKFILSMYQSEIKKMNKAYTYAFTIVGTLKEWENNEAPISSKDQLELGRQTKTLSKYFKNLEKFQPIESQKQNETKQKVLLDLLHSEIQLHLQRSHEAYVGSFYLETKKLLQDLK